MDLSTGKTTKEPLSEELAYNFIGGRGVNSKYSTMKQGLKPILWGRITG